LVEGAINPLIATLYPQEKTHKLNVLHAWWPGGLVIGGVLAFALGVAGASWQIELACILIPAGAYLALALSRTESLLVLTLPGTVLGLFGDSRQPREKELTV
jgi:MFS family permease